MSKLNNSVTLFLTLMGVIALYACSPDSPSKPTPGPKPPVVTEGAR